MKLITLILSFQQLTLVNVVDTPARTGSSPGTIVYYEYKGGRPVENPVSSSLIFEVINTHREHQHLLNLKAVTWEIIDWLVPLLSRHSFFERLHLHSVLYIPLHKHEYKELIPSRERLHRLLVDICCNGICVAGSKWKESMLYRGRIFTKSLTACFPLPLKTPHLVESYSRSHQDADKT